MCDRYYYSVFVLLYLVCLWILRVMFCIKRKCVLFLVFFSVVQSGSDFGLNFNISLKTKHDRESSEKWVCIYSHHMNAEGLSGVAHFPFPLTVHNVF